MTTPDRVKAETALTALSTLDFACAKDGWRELTKRLEDYERGTATVEDLQFVVPSVAPVIASHFDGKHPVVLEASNMWTGYHYTLSPGQRRWFRDFTGLTPTFTITVQYVECWPGTQHPRSFKVVSDVHVDERHRKHVLTEGIVRDVGKFFLKAKELDEEERIAKVLNFVPGKVNVWRGAHTRAVKELTERKPIGDAEDMIIVSVDGDTVVMKDFCENKFVFSKDEFQGIVTDIDNGVRSAKQTSPSRSSSAPSLSLDELMAQLKSGQVPV